MNTPKLEDSPVLTGEVNELLEGFVPRRLAELGITAAELDREFDML